MAKTKKRLVKPKNEKNSFPIALVLGKTGTAQVISSTGGFEHGHYILSFLGMTPMNDPEILCYLAIDKPQKCVQYGGTVAAILVGEIMEQSQCVANIVWLKV